MYERTRIITHSFTKQRERCQLKHLFRTDRLPWTSLNPTEMGSGWLAQSRAHPRINRYSNMNERASRSSMALLWNANTSRITSQAANITVPYSNYFKLLILSWGNPSRERNAPEHLRHLLSLKKTLPAKLQHRLLNANPEWSAWLLGAKTGNPAKLACISVSTCVRSVHVSVELQWKKCLKCQIMSK